jgi:hypothetical protein
VFGRVEPYEVAGRERSSTPSTGELTLTADNIAFKTDERPRPGANNAVLAVDEPAGNSGIKDLAGERRISRNCLDPVDGVGQRQPLVLKMREQLHPERDNRFGVARRRIVLHTRSIRQMSKPLSARRNRCGWYSQREHDRGDRRKTIRVDRQPTCGRR